MSSDVVAAALRDLVERDGEQLGELEVRPADDRSDRLARHQQRPGERLGLPLVVGATSATGVDGMAVEAQRCDEAALGVVGLEDLDVRGVLDALGGQGGDAVAVDDHPHVCL